MQIKKASEANIFCESPLNSVDTSCCGFIAIKVLVCALKWPKKKWLNI